jgi:uncharacterized membrane protein
MLVPIPIGLFVFSFVCDLVGLWRTANPVWHMVAYYTMAGGIVGALLAAIPGLIDVLSLEESKAKRIGIWHMVINLTVVGLFAVSLWLRTGETAGSGLPLMLSLVAILLLVVSGWLGGEMVYVHGVGSARERQTP